jgi:PKD repeat protein
MYMGPFSLVNTGSHDIFLAKYDSNGDEKWLKGVKGSGPDYPYDVAIDNFGSVYTTGYFESPFIKFDSHIIYNNGYIDLFLAKYDSLGNNVWARSFGGSGTDKAYDIDVDSLNNLYAIGYFNSSSISLDTITLYTNGMDDILTIKFNSDGDILAAKNYGGTQDDYGAGVVVFGEDELAITGSFKSSVIEFDTLTLNNQDYEDAFVYCINQLYPQAQFTYIIDGNTVTFQNTSLYADSYLWDFGDGNTSDEINPVHQYSESGYYDVTLVANNTCGSDSLIQVVYICDFPVSNFSCIIDSFTVVFENLSFYADSYIWDFGDGNVSTLENPVHTYELEGEYTVTLISINTCGSDTLIDLITICIQLIANFDQLINGLQVSFINLSQNADSYQWDFGDGNTSDEINPVHQYNESGYYDVTLVANNSCGSDSLTQVVYICDFPVSDFSYMIDSFTVVFENLSFFTDSYIWDFGDGNISTLENPVHTYELEGEYTVTLISINTCGSDTLSDLITICIPPIANFDQLFNGLQVSFINLSQNADSYQWDFGDGNTSEEINPVHIYQDGGNYFVTLQAYRDAGCYSEISQQLTVDSAIISHVVSIPNGWSGISSYVVPSDDTITHIFEPIVSEMYILMDGFGNVYWPDQGINTIYLWDSHHGYKIKTSDDLQLIIDGEIENNRTLNLYSGWNLIPVLSTQPVDCLELFEPLGDTLIIVKEIAGTNLYWPSENIYTLTLLLPGKAYLVYVIYNCTLTFTDTSYIAGQIYSPVTPKLVQPWNEIVKTGSSHIIAIYQNAMNKLQNGDIIGCFTESEVCAGLISIEDKTSSVAITVFGDDPTTFNVNEGFIEKESFHFRLYRESNDEIFDLNVQYDGNLPDLNVFKDNGLSVINGIELLISEYNDNSGLGSVLIYPNPAHNQITVQNATGFDNINVEISNLQGQILYQYNLFKPKEKINISSFEKGIYLIKVYTPVSSITKKIVKY